VIESKIIEEASIFRITDMCSAEITVKEPHQLYYAFEAVNSVANLELIRIKNNLDTPQ